MQAEGSRELALPRLDGRAWADLLARHRARWLDAAIAGREVVDLGLAGDAAEALSEAPRDAAIVWMDGVDESAALDVRKELRAAAERGVPVIVGLPGGSDDHHAAEELRSELGAGVLLAQELVVGSSITAEAPRRDPVLLLVCANVDATSTVDLEPEAAPLLSGQLARLERANQALREANSRLTREHLGVHDAAAAAIAARRTELEERVRELEEELERKTSEAAHYYRLHIGALQAPRYRAVDKLRDIAFKIPGVNLALRLRRRWIQARHPIAPPSDDETDA